MVSKLVAGMPARESGRIRAGDTLVAVGGASVVGVELGAVCNMIKGAY